MVGYQFIIIAEQCQWNQVFQKTTQASTLLHHFVSLTVFPLNANKVRIREIMSGGFAIFVVWLGSDPGQTQQKDGDRG